ncbi:MAG: leucine-rich repeat protein, partial [Draconibacterium sp.]|nr:leucine-rich repeat protein [Draconibacterium sp.]
AFASCKLASIFIPSSVASIDENAFIGIGEQINVDQNNKHYSSSDGVLFNKDRTNLIQCPVQKSGDYIIPSTVKIIGTGAFNLCNNINSVFIPPSVNKIEGGAFMNCASLRTLVISSTVNYIGSQALGYNSGLSSLYCMSSTPVDLSDKWEVFFGSNTTTCILYVPYGSKSLYSTASQWKFFKNIVEMSEFKLSATNVTIKAGQGSSASIDVTTNLAWNLNSDQNWLTINPLSATGKQSITLTAQANQSKSTRTALIKISTNEIPPQIIIVTQEAIPNTIPVAVITGNNEFDEGKSVTLDGSKSYDNDGDSISYQWLAPAGITLSSATAAQPTFTAPEVISNTNYTFSLVVNDGMVDSPADQVVITVKQVNKAPIANAGTDQSVNESATITLDGSLSSDLDGNPLTYIWTIPTGITLSSTTAAKPTFTAPEVKRDSVISFSLIVNDGKVSSAPDAVKITVLNVIKVGNTEISSPAFKVYPNPTTGMFILEFNQNSGKKAVVSVSNLIGNEVFQKVFEVVEKIEVDLSNQVSGIYLLKVIVDSQQYISKIVLSRQN